MVAAPEDTAACTCQRAFRGYRARGLYFEAAGLRFAALSVQTAWRQHWARNMYYEAQSACGEIQDHSVTDGIAPRVELAQDPARRFLAAPALPSLSASTMIQQAWRCHAARLTYYMLLGIEADFGNMSPPETAREEDETERERLAVSTIQRNFRCFRARNTYYELLASPPQSMDISANNDEKAAAPPAERAAATPLKEEAVTANAHNDVEQHEQHLAEARTKQVSAPVKDAAELQVHAAILRVDGAACTIQQSFRCCIGKFFRSFPEVPMPPRATGFTVDTDFKTSAPTVLVHFFG